MEQTLAGAVAAYWSSISVTTVGYPFQRPVGLPSRLQSCAGSGSVMFDRRTSKPHAEPAKSDRHQPLPSNAQARMVARPGLTIALVLSALWIAADFLPALGWAAIIAITAWPLYVRCIPYLGETRSAILAPLIFTALIAAIVFVPLALAAHQIARQGDSA